MNDISDNQTGHRYVLNSHEDPHKVQSLLFINKSDGAFYHDGTTNEEVIRMLIDRIQKLNAKFPCNDNLLALHNLKLALGYLEQRTRDRQARGVEGKATL